MKLTKQLKQDWLTALKSGKYKQGFYTLKRFDDNSYCCLGVLACVMGEEIVNCESSTINHGEYNLYGSFGQLMGAHRMGLLFQANDSHAFLEDYPRDYSNVIPLIEKLPTVD